MKKILVLMLLLLLTGCTDVVEVPGETIVIEKMIDVEVVRELTYSEMKEIEDKLRDELQSLFDKDLETAINNLEPTVVYRDGVEIREVQVDVIKEVKRELTEVELTILKNELSQTLQEKFDDDLKKAIDDLEPVTIIQEKIVKEPIDGEKFSKEFTVCTIKNYDSDGDYSVYDVSLETSFIFQNYTLTLKKPDVNGQVQWTFKNNQKITECHQTFGDLG